MRSRFRRRAVTTALLLGSLMAVPFASSQAADKPPAVRTIGWEELVPKGWDPITFFRGQSRAAIAEGSPEEQALMLKMREAWDNAPTRADLEGQQVKMPGYIVPLEMREGGSKEFLLVPYFGACVHSPPPPANQLVHVVLKAPKTLNVMDAVWVTGTLKTSRQGTVYGTSGYRMEGMAIEPYQSGQR